MNKESNRIEYKRSLTDKLEKEVVGFLNYSEGGEIYIGINDDGSTFGVQNTDKVQLEIKERIKNHILPSTLGLFDIQVIERDHLNVIKIIIASGTEKPYYIRQYGLSVKGAYIRIGSSTEQMTQEMIDDLYSRRTRNSLSRIHSPKQSLSFEQLKIYYNENDLTPSKNFLNTLELYADDGSYNYVAYLLNDVNNISIKVAKYRGCDRSDLIENGEYGYCSLIKATKNILNKLDMENKTITKISSKERMETRLVDPISLREALINAIVHNDYSEEVPPKFEIFNDRIEIISSGGLPQNLSQEEFFEGYSAPRNKELIRVFKDLKLVEQLGSGVIRILKKYDRSVFTFSSNYLKVTFKYPIDILDQINVPINDRIQHFNLSTHEMNILDILKYNPYITIQELATLLEISNKTISRSLNHLKSLEIIKRVGSNKTGYWEIL